MKEWGESFWEETEYRVKEITRRIESQLEDSLKSSLGPRYASLLGNVASRETLSEEERVEVRARVQEVVSRAQVEDLNQVMKVLGQVLLNRQHPYYVVVDHLDENWVEEKLRYLLIKALFLTSREFIGVSNSKVIVALRRDLIDRVLRLTRDAGFQEEKLAGNFLRVTWTKDHILEILDVRVKRLVSRRYTKQAIEIPGRLTGGV